MVDVLVREKDELLQVILNVLCLPVDGVGDVLVGDEDELPLRYLLQHVLDGDENELLHVYLLLAC